MREPPPRVARAADVARTEGFDPDQHGPGPTRCSDHTGRLLGLLVAARLGGRFVEIGTGTGYAAAWMVSAMDASSTLVTIEIDPTRAAVAADLLAGDPRVTVAVGDAGDVIEDLVDLDVLFVDGGRYGREPERFRSLIGRLRVGGAIVVDDVTPVGALPPDSPYRTHDPKREAFASEDLWTTEVVNPDLSTSTLVGVRLR
jgi:predicted O-methyltransferase YrrM